MCKHDEANVVCFFHPVQLDTPEARALADEIARKIAELEQKMKEAIARQVWKAGL